MEKRLVPWVVAVICPALFAIAASQESLCWAPSPAGSAGMLPAPAELLIALWIAKSVSNVLRLLANTLLKC